MTTVRIYKPCRSTMQAGLAATQQWILEFPPEAPRLPDPLMGWTSARDTKRQIRLRFSSLTEALAYARHQELDVEVETAQSPQLRPKSYADNFAVIRAFPWSH